jgi:hypothetical protein
MSTPERLSLLPAPEKSASMVLLALVWLQLPGLALVLRPEQPAQLAFSQRLF